MTSSSPSSWPCWRAALAGALALMVAGCGAPGGKPPATAPTPEPSEDPGPPPPTTAAVGDPTLQLEVEWTPRAGVEALALDMVSAKVRLVTQDPADLAIPGPPALTLEIRPVDGGDPLVARPHALRPKGAKGFPVSLEAGESLELGPMDLGTFDLDPLRIVQGKRYAVVARYRPGPEAKEHEVRHELVLAPASADFPLGNPLDSVPPVRPAVPLRIRGTDGAVRVDYLWSPDTGLEVPVSPDDEPGADDEPPPEE